MLKLATCNGRELSDKLYQLVSDTVYKHCGINLQDGKKELVRSRLAKLIRKHQMSSYEEYLNEVLSNPGGQLFSEFVDSLTTNLTMFYRESGHFDFLTSTVIPSMLGNKSKYGSHKIRVWSAGCSSGEEPYTLGMVLKDKIQDPKWDIKILATDISTAILQSAKKAVYEKAKVSALPQNLRVKYVQSVQNDPGMVHVSNEITSLVSFKYLNLIQPFPFKGPFDFIFCRNVMIYFDRQTQEKLVNNYWKVLSPGGVLFTGHSESLTGINHSFKYVKPTIYMKD